MKVIQFPGASEFVDKKIKYVKPLTNDNILMGDIQFTCPNCATKNTFSTSNLIFKSLDFFCGNCGQHHKIVNPAFSTKKQP